MGEVALKEAPPRSDTSFVAKNTYHYGEIVERLSTALFARDMGREDVADWNIRAALEIARTLGTDEMGELVSG